MIAGRDGNFNHAQAGLFQVCKSCEQQGLAELRTGFARIYDDTVEKGACIIGKIPHKADASEDFVVLHSGVNPLVTYQREDFKCVKTVAASAVDLLFESDDLFEHILVAFVNVEIFNCHEIPSL